MAVYPFQLINTRGIATIESIGVTATATEVTFTFNSDSPMPTPFRGLLVVKLAQAIPAGTATTLPVIFTSQRNGSQNVTTYNGVNATVAEFSGTGVYLFYYDRLTNVLQLIS